MLLRLRVNNPAAHNSTRDSAACTTTRDFCPQPLPRPVERLAPRRASTGLALAVIHAGATPNRIPVNTEMPNANARTGSEGVAWIGTYSFWKARYRITLVPT